jgi:2-phosphosulfolactate phosphatase
MESRIEHAVQSAMDKRFVIDGLPESAARYRTAYAVVTIDVIRATTTAITAASTGRRCFPAPSLEGALRLASILDNPILAGELDGDMPQSFCLNNSPAALSERSDISRPLVLLSSSGTKLMCNAMGSDAAYVACFRNCSSLSRELVAQGHPRIALLGAGTRGNFREEDQLCCAWIGAELTRCGYAPQDRTTSETLERWSNRKSSDCLISKSVDYLRRTGQLADLDFILNRVNDLDEVFVLERGEVIMKGPTPRASSHRLLKKVASGSSRITTF